MTISDASPIKKHVMDYLQQLGLEDGTQLEEIAAKCLTKAQTKVRPGAINELSRRALKEAQKHFNESIAQTFNLSEDRDLSKIAGIKAALLLCDCKPDSSKPDELTARLRGILPVATPPEAPLRMPEQPISFFFDAS